MRDFDLVIQYFPDSDTLRLSADVPPSEGETVAKWLMVERSKDDQVTGVVLRNADKVLRPYLFPDTEADSGAREDELTNKKTARANSSTTDHSTRELAD